MQPSSYKHGSNKVLCDVSGWFVSEKLDGMKGRWIDGNMFTRSGHELKIPDWFRQLLPKRDIEGELYFGPNTFHHTASLRATSKQILSTVWDKVSFRVFDVVDYSLIWMERQVELLELFPTSTERISIVKWEAVNTPKDVENQFQRVLKKGGEGVIIADPWGLYKDGHVESILKYKALHEREAIITGYQTGNENRLKSLIVRDVDRENIQFNIGTGLKLAERFDYEKKFPIGAMVSYNYELLGANGKPRTPIFKGVRIDL